MSTISNVSPSDVFFQALNAPKLVFGQGVAPDSADRAYDAPQPSRLRWGYPLPITFHLDVFGFSILMPPLNKIPGYAYAVH